MSIAPLAVKHPKEDGGEGERDEINYDQRLTWECLLSVFWLLPVNIADGVKG